MEDLGPSVIIVGLPVVGGGADRLLYQDANGDLKTDADLTYDGTTLKVGGTGTETAPNLVIGDGAGAPGFYPVAGGGVYFTSYGSKRFHFNEGSIDGTGGTNFKINVNQAGSNTVPTYQIEKDITTTGIGGASGALSLITGGASRIFVDTSGNAGFGGQTSPSYPVDVTGGIRALTNGSVTTPHADADNLVLEDNANNSNVGISILTDDGGEGHIYFGDQHNESAGRITYVHGTPQRLQFEAGGNQAFVTTSTGIAVGTTSATNIRLRVLGSGSGGLTPLSIENGTGSAVLAKFIGTATQDVDLLQFRNSTTIKSVVDATGQFGIQNTAPAYPLDVTGDVRISAVGRLGDAGSAPTMNNNECGWYGLDVGGTVEFHVIDEAGNASQLSPHAKDGPDTIYTDPATGKGVELVASHANVYRGEIVWRHLTDPSKQPITETFDQYNTRRGLSPGDPGYWQQQDWDANQDLQNARRQEKQAAWDELQATLAADRQEEQAAWDARDAERLARWRAQAVDFLALPRFKRATIKRPKLEDIGERPADYTPDDERPPDFIPKPNPAGSVT